jgi:hypothetical protein
MTRPEKIVAWLRDRFVERPSEEGWRPEELISRAWADHIDLKHWMQCPAVRGVVEVNVPVEEWPGFFEPHWLMAKREANP